MHLVGGERLGWKVRAVGNDDAPGRYWKTYCPDESLEAAACEETIRNDNIRLGKMGLPGKAFLHRSWRTLPEADLVSAVTRQTIAGLTCSIQGVRGF